MALTLYVVDLTGDELWRINPDNPSDTAGDFGEVGGFPSGISPLAQAMTSHAGSLYVTDDSDNELWRINPDNPSDDGG